MALGFHTSYKSFPETIDGNQFMVQFMVKFSTKEERDAFEAAVSNLRTFLGSISEEDRREAINGFKFGNTLQYQVAQTEVNSIKKIFGLLTFNCWAEDNIVICYPETQT